MFSDIDVISGTARSASAQGHPGSVPTCAGGSPSGVLAPPSCPARHPPLPAPLGGVGVGVNLPPPAAGGWIHAAQVGQEGCPMASPPPGRQCHSGRTREAEGSRVLGDTHQSTPNTRSSSCPPQTPKMGVKTLMPVLPWGAASLGRAPTQDPCPWSTASMLHSESPVAADAGFSFHLNHLI